MKKVYFLLIIVLISSIFSGCKETEKEKREKSIELMTSQTLGLAYLEEFKLDDAEREFFNVIKLAPNEKFGYANLGLTYLRMGKYMEAEKQLFKAREIDSVDADISLILATVYQMDDKKSKAISVLSNALSFAPEHVKVLYDLSELYSSELDDESHKSRKAHLLQLVEKATDNIVPHLKLTDVHIRSQENDAAIEQLEIIRKQFPEFPKEAIEYFDKTISLLRKSDTEGAIIQFTIFHNYLKVTFPYQNGIKDLKGPGGSLIGFPLITYDMQSSSQAFENKSLLEVIKFTNITESVGLDIVSTFDESENFEFKYSTHVEAADYDGDGDVDLYIGNYDPISSSYKHYLFNNDMARFWDVAQDVGIKHTGKESSAIFADYDNDGYLDIYVNKDGGNILYRNVGKSEYEDVTSDSKIDTKKGGNKALFFDYDHDGDLDLFEIKSDSNIAYRNNGDGTFLLQKNGKGVFLKEVSSRDAAFGDFDDDGDIDLFVATQNENDILFDNQRQGIFEDTAKESGLIRNDSSSSVTVGDYNNDGFLDLLVTSVNGENSKLYRNQSNGNFEIVKGNRNLFSELQGIKVHDSEFFDFDNDGLIDIIVVGESKENEKRGIFLFHNEGNEKFINVSNLLPEEPSSGKEISLFDYNSDGDLDLLIAGINGGVSLLRNDGGSINHYVNLKLVGLRTGSAKNNYFGIGAKVEMRAGELYQTMVVTKPNVHIGLGKLKEVDIIRITWTNGVPQNIFLPDADQALIESQTLKGSCPFLYTWNGKEYVFVKDITWRSALGMPLGIMGGNTMHAFADASDDYIKIPGEILQPKNGQYSIKVTSELWETIYMDNIELVAVDHPNSIDIFVPEQFSPPPFTGMDISQVKKKYIPVSARDSKGNDLLSFIAEKDDNYLHNFKPEKYQGVTEMHELILDPGDVGNSEKLFMYLNGWIFPTDASINVALSQSDKLEVVPPIVQMVNRKGEWETVIENLGFPMGKDKTVIADISDKFLSKDLRIKIKTNMEIYWDHIFFSDGASRAPMTTTILKPVTADLQYRGFSRSYRKGGRYGPHWFDYQDVETNNKWRDLTGSYTRYGDVLPLLNESDNKYIISNAGDETSISFDANKLPKLPDGWKRDFLIRSVGWVKDGDINTALGSTVLPLPFHGMKSYPPSNQDVYPNNPELQKYLKEFNTRKVTREGYHNSIKPKN